MKIFQCNQEVKCEDAASVFARLYSSGQRAFLLESKDISHIYGRLSLIGIDPVFELIGKNEKFEIVGLNERAANYLSELSESDFEFCEEANFGDEFVRGVVKKSNEELQESERTKKRNIAQVVRVLLEKFKREKKGMLGLYGAFSYDFIRLFEDLPKLLVDQGVADFRLFLYDTFVFFDHLKSEAEVICYRENLEKAETSCGELTSVIGREQKNDFAFKIKYAEFQFSENEYKSMVEQARELAKAGELTEVVYSNTLMADFSGDSFALYLKYREANPSPYLFYFDFGDEQLVGASPEMMVRCEGGQVHLRPISGTARRGNDPIEDHENMLELLKSPKERAELDMLIDLGRNDLARICEPGIEVSDYRFVEKYSKVMHTVAHVTGKLEKNFIALDALIACLNAGTLTGAPKVAAMKEIEKAEKTRRGYYGGSIGYLTFSGDMDTGIIIRTAHIKDGRLSFRAGATLLYDSNPAAEYQEILNKMSAFLTTFEA